MTVESAVFICSICGEPSTEICAFCTKDTCANHRCDRCKRCSDCCECEVPLSAETKAAPEQRREPETPEPPPQAAAPEPDDFTEPPPVEGSAEPPDSISD